MLSPFQLKLCVATLPRLDYINIRCPELKKKRGKIEDRRGEWSRGLYSEVYYAAHYHSTAESIIVRYYYILVDRLLHCYALCYCITSYLLYFINYFMHCVQTKFIFAIVILCKWSVVWYCRNTFQNGSSK